MKRKFSSNYECAHAWAAQTQDEGQGNSMHFKGPTIYSFGWWPMATYAKNKAGQTVVIVRGESYSSYTSRHQSYMRSAIKWTRVITIYPGREQSNVAEWTDCKLMRRRTLELIADALGKAKRARKNTQWHLDSAQRLADSFNELLTFVGTKRVKPITLDGELDADLAKLVLEGERQAKRDAKERREREAEIARREAAEEQESIRLLALWITGEAVSVWALRRQPCRLRVKDNEIETSHGASVPVSYAPRLWSLIEHVRARETKDYYYPAGDYEVGRYRLNYVTNEGDLRIGCHDIPYDSIKPIAIQLGLAS